MLAMTFVMAGPEAALTQGTGLLAAHMYDFLTRLWPQFGGGRSYIQTPQFVRRWFARLGGTSQARAYGTAFQSRTASGQTAGNAGSSTGGGWTSGFSTGSWGGRGAGRRLGGD